MTVQPGQQLMMNSQNGQQMPVVVKEVAADHLMLDANHPMAGKDLNFEIQLLEVDAKA
jgi:peptidylprolyl isomerase